jgi:glycosyltransferase involved in cell wall biosynthesis
MAIYQYLIGRVIIESAKRADKIIVQSNWMKNALCSKMNKDSNKIVCIYPSINDCSKYRKDNEFNPHSFFYPTSSYIYKNNECIYQASRFLNRKGIQNFNVKMTVHIDGKHPNIDFIGRIPREQVLEEYNRSTLILPSYIESFPLPLEEAKQMGTIILASDCDFSREILDDYENAYYFNPFCPEKLSDLMEKVLNKSIVRKDIKHESINKDLKSYRGWEAVVESILLKD